MNRDHLKTLHSWRDDKIINIFSKYLELPIEININHRLSNSKPESDIKLALEDCKDFPIIFGANSQTEQQVLYDTLFSKENIDIFSALNFEWENFFELLVKEASLPASERINTIFFLARATTAFRFKYGGRKTQELVERIWKHRWLIDANLCGDLLWDCSSPIEGTPLGLDRSPNEHEYIFNKITSMVEEAKTNCQSLDEWFEDLYLLSPWVKYAEKVFESCEDPDKDKFLRWRSELIADISTVWKTGILFGNLGNDLNAYYWDINQDTSSLYYEYTGRVMFPKFWYEAVVEASKSGVKPSKAIGHYSKERLLSIYLCYAIPFQEDVSFIRFQLFREFFRAGILSGKNFIEFPDMALLQENNLITREELIAWLIHPATDLESKAVKYLASLILMNWPKPYSTENHLSTTKDFICKMSGENKQIDAKLLTILTFNMRHSSDGNTVYNNSNKPIGHTIDGSEYLSVKDQEILNNIIQNNSESSLINVMGIKPLYHPYGDILGQTLIAMINSISSKIPSPTKGFLYASLFIVVRELQKTSEKRSQVIWLAWSQFFSTLFHEYGFVEDLALSSYILLRLIYSEQELSLFQLKPN